MAKLLTPREWGEALNPPISERRAVALCNYPGVKGAEKVGRQWVIKAGAPDPRKDVGRPAKH